MDPVKQMEQIPFSAYTKYLCEIKVDPTLETKLHLILLPQKSLITKFRSIRFEKRFSII